MRKFAEHIVFRGMSPLQVLFEHDFALFYPSIIAPAVAEDADQDLGTEQQPYARPPTAIGPHPIWKKMKLTPVSYRMLTCCKHLTPTCETVKAVSFR
jgi:hypothetical protein